MERESRRGIRAPPRRSSRAIDDGVFAADDGANALDDVREDLIRLQRAGERARDIEQRLQLARLRLRRLGLDRPADRERRLIGEDLEHMLASRVERAGGRGGGGHRAEELPPVDERHTDERTQPYLAETCGAWIGAGVLDLQGFEMRRDPALDALVRTKTARTRRSSRVAKAGPDNKLAALPIQQRQRD